MSCRDYDLGPPTWATVRALNEENATLRSQVESLLQERNAEFSHTRAVEQLIYLHLRGSKARRWAAAAASVLFRSNSVVSHGAITMAVTRDRDCDERQIAKSAVFHVRAFMGKPSIETVCGYGYRMTTSGRAILLKILEKEKGLI